MMRGGRGGGRGAFSINREQLKELGVTGNDALPGPVTQPPPLFPKWHKIPQPFSKSVEQDYMLILKQDFIDHMQLSGSYLKLPQTKQEEPVHEIDKLVAVLPVVKEKYNWKLFPSELRPKLLAKRIKKQKELEAADINERLAKLEKIEENKKVEADDKVKEETQEVDDDEMEELEDEEMDDGVDYTNNYFDNGESYADDDDNSDDGPIF